MKRSIRKSINSTSTQRCQICNEPEILVEHHINGRKFQNYNVWWNLAYICSNCHNKVHHGIIIIEKWVQTTRGKELLWHYANEVGVTNESAICHLI